MATIGDIYKLRVKDNQYSLFELMACDVHNDKIWIIFRPILPNNKFMMTHTNENVDIDKELYESGFIKTNITTKYKGKIIIDPEDKETKYVILGSDNKYLYCVNMFDDIDSYIIRKIPIMSIYNDVIVEDYNRLKEMEENMNNIKSYVNNDDNIVEKKKFKLNNNINSILLIFLIILLFIIILKFL